MSDDIGIRDLLWEWSRAYPERPGDCVDWYRQSNFAGEIISDGWPEERTPIDYQRAEKTDAAILIYLNALQGRRSRAKAIFEEGIFWLRYFRRWELQDVARRMGKSQQWIKTQCQVIEGSIETAMSVLPDDLTASREVDTFVQAAVFTQ